MREPANRIRPISACPEPDGVVAATVGPRARDRGVGPERGGPGGEADLQAEAASHLAALAEQREREGLPSAHARLLARREFGGVVQAAREIGICLALGATRAAVMRDVTRRGVMPVSSGLAIGTVGGAFMGQAGESLLYCVSVGDLANYALTIGVLTDVSVPACAQPAWRAAHTNPLQAIRSE